MKKLSFIFVVVLLLVACATAEPEIITETVEVPVTVEVEVPVEVTREVEVVQEVEVTRIVTEEVTRVVEVETVVEITATPTPAPAEFLTVAGSGNHVTDNFDWQACNKAVFGYEATGSSNLFVYIWKVGATDNRLLINDIAPASGEVLQPLSGGTYWLDITATGEWSISGICED